MTLIQLAHWRGGERNRRDLDSARSAPLHYKPCVAQTLNKALYHPLLRKLVLSQSNLVQRSVCQQSMLHFRSGSKDCSVNDILNTCRNNKRNFLYLFDSFKQLCYELHYTGISKTQIGKCLKLAICFEYLSLYLVKRWNQSGLLQIQNVFFSKIHSHIFTSYSICFSFLPCKLMIWGFFFLFPA